MKRLLLSLFFCATLLMELKAQISLNEVHPYPASALGSFVELYNWGSAGENLDCYTLVTYAPYSTGSGGSAINYDAFYVYSFNSSNTVAPGNRFVLDISNMGTAGTLTKYEKIKGSIANYTEVPQTAIPSSILLNASDENFVLLMKRSTTADVVVIKNKLVDAQALVGGFDNLPQLGAPCSSYDRVVINFQLIADQLTDRNVAPAIGAGSSASRLCDGPCFGWVKQPAVTKNSANCASAPTSGPNIDKVWFQPSWTFTIANYETQTPTSFDGVINVSGGISQTTVPSNAIANDILNKTFTFRLKIAPTNNAALSLPIKIYTFPDSEGPEGYGFPDGEVDQGQESKIYVYDQNLILPSVLNQETDYLTLLINLNIPYDGTYAVKAMTFPGTSCEYSTIFWLRNGASALPITLKSFKVTSHSSSNKLNWITSSEQNNKGFEVQKSVGNGQDFRTIGFVGTKAKDGNSNTDISYNYEDADVKAGTMHYYRLKQIDFDGKFTYSAIKSIKPGSIESNLNVYPNPSQGSFTLTTGAASGKVNVFLLDNTGRVINQYMNVSSSNTKFNNLKKGFYTLKIVDVETGEQSAQRVVVQ